MEKLTQTQIDALRVLHNWGHCEYDNNGVLVWHPAVNPDDAAVGWLAVTDEQIEEALAGETANKEEGNGTDR